METLTQWGELLLGMGTEPRDLSFLHCSMRGVLVLISALVMVRLGSKRALAEKTAIDTLTIVLVASVLSRAINGPSPLFASIGAAFIIVFVHRFLMAAAVRHHLVGDLIKGTAEEIVRDGKPIERVMRANQVSAHDLEEDLRLDAKVEDLSEIKVARIERSGDISFIKRERQN